MTLKYGELCAGYGGLAMGLQSVLGGDLAWVSEFDPDPSRILAHHWPDVPNLGDMTKIDWTAVPHVDVLAGGTPCQDLSHAGKRAGMTEGTRSNLWVQMREAIAVIRPNLVVWENVRGAYSAEADSALEPCPRCVGDPRDRGVVLRALGRVLGDLSELGYDAWWYGLRAADVDGCHGRFRVFVFAVPADADDEGLETDGLPGWVREARSRWAHAAAPRADLAPSDEVKFLPTPRTSDANSPGIHGRGGQDLRTEIALLKTPTTQLAVNGGSQHPDKRREGGHGPTLADEVEFLLPTPRATDGTKGGPNQRGSSGDLMLPAAVLLPTPSVADSTGGHASRSGERGGELLLPGVAKSLAGSGDPRLLPTPTVSDHPDARRCDSDGETYSADGYERRTISDAVAVQNWGEYGPAIRRWENATGIPAPAPTETGAKGQPRLAPTFVEWMMGLPAGHVTDTAIWAGMTDGKGRVLTGERLRSASRNAQLKALGNGVVPQQAAAACHRFLRDAFNL